MCKNGGKTIKKRAAQAALVCKRVTRIELATTAWKAVVLPLNYTRNIAEAGLEPATFGL